MRMFVCVALSFYFCRAGFELALGCFCLYLYASAENIHREKKYHALW